MMLGMHTYSVRMQYGTTAVGTDCVLDRSSARQLLVVFADGVLRVTLVSPAEYSLELGHEVMLQWLCIYNGRQRMERCLDISHQSCLGRVGGGEYWLPYGMPCTRMCCRGLGEVPCSCAIHQVLLVNTSKCL